MHRKIEICIRNLLLGNKEVKFFYKTAVFVRYDKTVIIMCPSLGSHSMGNLGKYRPAWLPVFFLNRRLCSHLDPKD